MIKFDFQETSKRWGRYGEEYIKEGRLAMIFVIEKLLIVAIFILGIIGTLIQIYKIENIDKAERIILFIALIFGVLSIIFAVWALLQINGFMNSVGRIYEIRAEKLKSYMLDTGKESGNQYPEYLWSDKELKTDFLPWQFYIQVFFFFVGLVSIIIFIILKLEIF